MIPPIANDFVAAESPEGALDHAAALNARGVSAILNLLGEHYHERTPAFGDTMEYRYLAAEIDERDLDASISVKPSQIGLDIGADVFAENLADIVDHATEHGVFVWVDMEDHATTDATLDAVVENAARDGAELGVAIQANLKRTGDDLERLAATDAIVRLVKGAYDEPASIAYSDKSRVDEAYEEHLEYLFREFDRVAVGSHDPKMISLARRLHDEHDTPYEVQMLMGVRDDAQFDLADDGVRVVQYAPYGSKWAQYFYRRVMERKENLLFAARAVLT
ncbi:proline dehydrogenase family protein [Halarchaeum acidiphilum]|uniref:proline dehydrogenase family protein n=1 Tax=Halarchaeum acidiphilum TaxID=489138 RepID=UPI000677C6CA|nr:proline dehydrogenase family protein [Halarchaeum acidiphilum]